MLITIAQLNSKRRKRYDLKKLGGMLSNLPAFYMQLFANFYSLKKTQTQAVSHLRHSNRIENTAFFKPQEGDIGFR